METSTFLVSTGVFSLFVGRAEAVVAVGTWTGNVVDVVVAAAAAAATGVLTATGAPFNCRPGAVIRIIGAGPPMPPKILVLAAKQSMRIKVEYYAKIIDEIFLFGGQNKVRDEK